MPDYDTKSFLFLADYLVKLKNVLYVYVTFSRTDNLTLLFTLYRCMKHRETGGFYTSVRVKGSKKLCSL